MLAAEKQASRPEQLQALRLLGRGVDRREEDTTALTNLLMPQTAEEVQAAAMAALGGLSGASGPELLLRGWKSYGPSLRSQALDVLFRREAWYAGKIALIRPTRAATASAAIYVEALTLKPPKKVPFGIFEITISNRDAAEAPIRPPSKEIVTASLK